jgi:5'-nucleotidase
MIEKVHIYHTNDIHSHFENWPKIRSHLQMKKTLHLDQEKDNVFLFDIGDHVDRWHPFTEGTFGKGNVQLLNELGYTAVTIGNNEGITLSHAELDTLYNGAKFDVIVANLFDQTGNRPTWALPSKIYHTKSGVKIGVVAVTAYFGKLYELLDWHLTEPIPQLVTELRDLKGKTDIIIVLSHLGIHDDEKIAMLYPEVDIILGGHTHHVLPDGKSIANTLLAAAGKHGNYVGYVKVEINVKNKTIVKKSAMLNETRHLPAPTNENDEITFLHEEGYRLLNTVLLEIPETLEIEWFHDSPLSQLLCEAINEWCDADCSFINAGLLLGHLQKGKITKYDIHKILPHPINPCLIELSGYELKKVLVQTFDPKWPNLELKGLGFRGKILGNFIYHNIKIDGEMIYIQGEQLNEKKKYKLGTVDMFTYGHFFSEFLRAKKKYFMPEFIRDVMTWKLQKEYNEN